MSLSYTGKLFRRIAICCGAWTGDPHKVWRSSLECKYRNEYSSELIYGPFRRGENNKWKQELELDHTNDYMFWTALWWLRDNDYISLRDTRNSHRNCYGYVSFTFPDTEIRLTEKGLAAAPAYMKQKED